MSQTLPNLSLPLMQASQAQKHVTHNEALHILDNVTQLSVISSSLETPPAQAENGDCYLVPAGASAGWAGLAEQIAVFDGNSWQAITPKTGWLAFDQSRNEYLYFDSVNWTSLPQSRELANLQQIGINTTADSNNRLSISAPATLFSHQGGGHQIKVNKSSGNETASLLFQSNWSGHAEMGLNGSNDWSIKISPDGATWQEALAFDSSSGAVSGTSVQNAPDDTTPGRLMRTDYGYCPGNILGTVAQSNGQPTGAIIESASTTDGEYTRFANGLMICTSSQFSTDVTTNAGAIFQSPVLIWNFPATFFGAPVVSGGNVNDIAKLWVSAGQAGVSSCSAIVFAHTSATGASFSLTAVGRWF